MKSRLFALVLVLAGFTFAAKAANITIAVINESTVLSDSQVRSALPAFQAQVRDDFAPAWGIDADLVFVPRGRYAPAGSWWLVILDNSDQADALGYHDVTSSGTPLGKVFAASDMKYGYSWTVTTSHELLEMLADPYINLTVFLQLEAKTGYVVNYEVADACESERFAYYKYGVKLSDFVFPAWFQYERGAGSTQFDFMGYISYPFQLLRGGYIGVFEVKSGSWSEVTAENLGDGPEEKMGGPSDATPRIDYRTARRHAPASRRQKSDERIVAQ